MKQVIAALLLSLLSVSAFAAKLECKTNQAPDYGNPSLQDFRCETENGRLVKTQFTDMYGDWNDVGANSDSKVTETVNKDGSIRVEVAYEPGHDYYIGQLDLKVGHSEYREESFVDCLGTASLISTVDCAEVK